MYDYQTQRPFVFTDEGQRMLLRVRDGIAAVLPVSGVVTLEKAMQFAGGGNSWDMIACVDRLVELGELVEVKHDAPAGQYRIFRGKKWSN